MIAAHVGGHGWGLPGLAPIRNSCELRGLCCRSYFGPRTCGRGITNTAKCAGLSIRVSPSHPYNAGNAGLGSGSWWLQRNVYAACRGYVVVFVVGKVWRIVPCVYNIYTLDRFQFHGLLKNNPIRFSGGGKYELLGVCFFYGC
jgi:hypothetical protein